MDVDRTAWRSTLVKSHDESKTYILVKLSESFSNAIQEYSTPTIKFQGSRGAIKFPNGKNYDFSLEQQDRDVECIRQTKHRWESVGKVACCLHVKGKDDVYQRTRTKMAAAEKEKRKYCTKLLGSPDHDSSAAPVTKAPPTASLGGLNTLTTTSRASQPNNINHNSTSRVSSKLLDPAMRASSSATTATFGANPPTAATNITHSKSNKISSNNNNNKHHHSHKNHLHHNHNNNINHNNHLITSLERNNHNHYNHATRIDSAKGKNNSSYINNRATDVKSSSSLLSSSSSSSSSSASSSSSSAPASTSTTTTTTNNISNNGSNNINLSKYPDITNVEQLKRYKTDFDKDFKEYQHLHGYLHRIEERFKQLKDTLKQSVEGSPEWESAKEEIFSEYDRVKGDSNFHRARSKYKQLYDKLAHIKEKIFRFKRDYRDKCNSSKKRKR